MQRFNTARTLIMPHSFFPFVTFLIILSNIVIHFTGYGHFAFQLSTTFDNWSNLFDVVRYMFCHTDANHIFGNMFWLLLVGPVVEKRFGTVSFAVLYLSAGISGAFLEGMTHPDAYIVGASGAIAGLMAVYPFVQRSIISRLIGSVLVGFYFVDQFSSFLSIMESGLFEFFPTAYLGHIGGGIGGLLYLSLSSRKA